MKNTEITNSEDIIDSRDIITRIEDLRGTLSALCDAISDADNEEDTESAKGALADWLGCSVSDLPSGLADLTDLSKSGFTNSDEAQELASLEKVASQGEGYGDWSYGETLIRDSYFRDYAEQLADDLGAVPKDQNWPCCHIDWDAAADALKADYTSIDFDGVEYWMRA